jgi:DNA invertase Pin-like site-specific DNA recombinase
MLTVLGGLAEFERHLILARTSEGRHRAQQRGVRFGPLPWVSDTARRTDGRPDNRHERVLTVAVLNDKARGLILDGPRRGESAVWVSSAAHR